MHSMPLRASLIVLAGMASLPALDFGTTSQDLRLVVGVATPIGMMQVNDIAGTSQRLDAKRKTGPHVGVQWQYTSLNGDGAGWTMALEGAWDHHVGAVQDVNGQPAPFAGDGANMVLDTWMGNVFIGPSLQADLRDWGVRADTFRVELGPTFGYGLAQAAVDSNNSNMGRAWTAGGQIAFITAFENDVTLSLIGGYEYTRATVAWDNTSDSDVTAQGPMFRLGLGYRW